ncbi:MAG: transporter substrate-binding domain-containing protein, partial [Comamonadaceae bacterium]
NPKDFRIVGEPLGVEPIALMLRKDDPKFKAAVDGVITKMMASGELEKLYVKWFMQPIPPTNAVIGIPFPQTLKTAFGRPNDDPAEAYEKE